MYRIKRFSKVNYNEKPSKSKYAIGAAIQGGILADVGYTAGKLAGQAYGYNKFNKYAKNINEKHIPDLVKRAREGSEFAADTLRQLNHPKTKKSLENIAKESIRRGGKIGGRLGAVTGLGIGAGSMAVGYKIHKNRYNRLQEKKK